MDSLATIARQRTLVTTIADAIVAVAAGKSLRVAVGWRDAGEAGFAEQLTRALLARGLPCRCVATKVTPAGADPTANPPGRTPMVAVITSGPTGPDETDLCRIDIALHTPDRQDGSAVEDDHRPDIVVDYLDPAGPIIRHIVPALIPPAGRSITSRRRPSAGGG